jgi:hypothetical protein
LRFLETGKQSFLKLDAKGKGGLAGWEDFFHGGKPKEAKALPVRGFYSAHPVKEVKKTAAQVAALGTADAKKDVAYLVTQGYGKGRVIYIGSGETWRLRLYRQDFYERFWKGLVNYVTGDRLK